MLNNDKKGPKYTLIIESASQVFGTHGFHTTNISDIASVANIGKSTVYEYFTSKEELFLAVVSHNINIYLKTIQMSVDPLATSRTQLEQFAKVHYDMVEKNYDQTLLYFKNPAQFTLKEQAREELCTIIMTMRLSIITVIVKILEQGILEKVIPYEDKALIADLLFEQINHLAIRGLAMKYDLEKICYEREACINLFLKGVQSCFQTTV
jgi:AcrR family transcriptional regulator